MIALPSLTPRGLTRDQAAAYCGLTPSAFANWVRLGIMPGPIPRTQRWDRIAIDRAFDQHSGIRSGPASDADAALARFRDRQASRHARAA